MAESENNSDLKNGGKTDNIKSAENSALMETKITDSDEVFEMFCETCMRDGTVETAYAFCPSCVAYFCSQCLKNHGKFFRKHVFLVGDDMYADICSEKCETHSNEIVKFYCEKCQKFVCTICKEDLHTDKCCLKYLPDFWKNRSIEKELELLNTDHKALIEKMSDCQTAISTKHEHFSNICAETQCVIKREKDKTFEKFDKEARQIEDQIQTMRKNDSTFLDTLKETNDSLAIEIDQLSVNIKNLTTTAGKRKYKMFIYLQQLTDKVKQAKTSFDTVSIAKTEQDLEKQAKNISKEVEEFGTSIRNIQPNVQNEEEIVATKNACFLHDINLRKDGDMKECDIIDCFMLSDQYLVVCDKSNCSLKLIDVKINKLVHEKVVPVDPEAIAKIDDYQIAMVQCYNEERSKIQFLTLTEFKTLKFLKKRFILTEMICGSIAYFKDDKLIISLVRATEGKVQIINMKGRVLIDISTNSNGEDIFKNPYCISVGYGAKYAYVSDWYKDEVIEINLDTFDTRSVAYIWHPDGLATDHEGCVYVIESGTGKLFYFHPDKTDSEMVELLKYKPFEWKPYGICFCSAEKKLYVGQSEIDTMKVLKITDIV